LFPRAEHLGGALTASLRCGGNSATASIDANADDATVRLDGREPRDAPGATIDVAFALDTTGSMSEEIAALKSTLQKVMARAANVRVGLVEYKDRGDEFTTRVYPMSRDLSGLSASVASMRASGGDDYPEAMNVGLRDAITKLEWNATAPAHLLFVIGDAPPHAHDQGPSYADSARLAAHAGIQIFSVAASGMDEFGQIVFRQIAQYTGGTELFVLRGGAGPASTGGGDPIKSSGGTQAQYRSGNLDALVIEKIDHARKALDLDPVTNP
jgi:Mg-chelatase subunit ChlD